MAGSLATLPAAPTLAQISAQAKALTDQSIAAQVSELRRQQELALAQAQSRAGQITSAAQAGARFLGGLGDKTQADYQAAVNNERGIASGFSGQLRTDADASAQEAQRQLASVPGNTQQVKSEGDSLANLLYGLGGQIPAHLLNVTGLGAVGAARALPSATLGYGMQESLGALGAGKKEAANLTGSILQAEAQRPTLNQNYFAQLSSAARDSQLAQSLIESRAAGTEIAAANASTAAKRAATAAKAQADTASYRTQRLAIDTDHTNALIQQGYDRNSIARFNAATSRYRATHAAKKGRTATGKFNEGQKASAYTAARVGTYYAFPTDPWKPLSGEALNGLVQAGVKAGSIDNSTINVADAQTLGLHVYSWSPQEMAQQLARLGYTGQAIKKALKGYPPTPYKPGSYEEAVALGKKSGPILPPAPGQ